MSEMIQVTLSFKGYRFDVEVDQETYNEIKDDELKISSYAEAVYKQLVTNKEPEVQNTNENSVDSNNFKWTHDSTLLLIDLRLNKEHEFNRPICKKKKLWTHIALEMNNIGNYAVTGDMCDSKYRNLLSTYKNNKKKKEQSGEGAVSWEFFEKFDSHLGKKASILPPPDTVGSVDGINSNEVSDMEMSEKEEPSTSKCDRTFTTTCKGGQKRKRVDTDTGISFNEYLKEKVKLDKEYRERKEKKDDERWNEKKILKEREILAIEALANAIASQHK